LFLCAGSSLCDEGGAEEAKPLQIGLCNKESSNSATFRSYSDSKHSRDYEPSERETENGQISHKHGEPGMGRGDTLVIPDFLYQLLFRLSEKDKYEITGWAFAYFMKSSVTVPDAVLEAVKKIRPWKINKDGSLKVSKKDLSELHRRVKNMI
jgi:hypothetical protein